DPDGNVATGFTGTVSFSASGGSPTLPSSYTFTAADAGRHTFTASFGAAATVTLTASSAGLTAGSQAGIQVHNQATVSLIPVADRRGMVYDTARDLLYIATDHGTVERYSPTARALLAPWQVGNALSTYTRSVAGGTGNGAFISRGSDRSLGFLTPPNISSGPVNAYRPATDTFSADVNTNQSLSRRPSSVNRNGSLIALELSNG